MISMATRSLPSAADGARRHMDEVHVLHVMCLLVRGKKTQRERGSESGCALYHVRPRSMHEMTLAACVCVCVSRQRRSEPGPDVKQLTLALHVFTTV